MRPMLQSRIVHTVQRDESIIRGLRIKDYGRFRREIRCELCGVAATTILDPTTQFPPHDIFNDI